MYYHNSDFKNGLVCTILGIQKCEQLIAKYNTECHAVNKSVMDEVNKRLMEERASLNTYYCRALSQVQGDHEELKKMVHKGTFSIKLHHILTKFDRLSTEFQGKDIQVILLRYVIDIKQVAL